MPTLDLSLANGIATPTPHASYHATAPLPGLVDVHGGHSRAPGIAVAGAWLPAGILFDPRYVPGTV